LAIYLLAVLCEAPRGSKDLAKFARKFRTPHPPDFSLILI